MRILAKKYILKLAIYLKQIRIKQWIKNIFIFIPLFFSGKIQHLDSFCNTVLGFFALCFVASSVYMINDMVDVEKDRIHPSKRFRPLASKLISFNTAIIITTFLFLAGVGLATYLDTRFLFIVILYFVINMAYSFGLKKVAILDITIIASGFILRIFSGGIIADVLISKWLVLMTFLLALLLALAKRRDDLLILEETGEKMRSSLDGYNFEFVNASMIFMASVTTVSYFMYTVSDEVVKRIGNDNVYLTSFPVVLGILRYLQITLVEENSGSPTKILYSDTAIKVLILIWVASFGFLLYF